MAAAQQMRILLLLLIGTAAHTAIEAAQCGSEPNVVYVSKGEKKQVHFWSDQLPASPLTTPPQEQQPDSVDPTRPLVVTAETSPVSRPLYDTQPHIILPEAPVSQTRPQLAEDNSVHQNIINRVVSFVAGNMDATGDIPEPNNDVYLNQLTTHQYGIHSRNKQSSILSSYDDIEAEKSSSIEYSGDYDGVSFDEPSEQVSASLIESSGEYQHEPATNKYEEIEIPVEEYSGEALYDEGSGEQLIADEAEEGSGSETVFHFDDSEEATEEPTPEPSADDTLEDEASGRGQLYETILEEVSFPDSRQEDAQDETLFDDELLPVDSAATSSRFRMFTMAEHDQLPAASARSATYRARWVRRPEIPRPRMKSLSQLDLEHRAVAHGTPLHEGSGLEVLRNAIISEYIKASDPAYGDIGTAQQTLEDVYKAAQEFAQSLEGSGEIPSFDESGSGDLEAVSDHIRSGLSSEINEHNQKEVFSFDGSANGLQDPSFDGSGAQDYLSDGSGLQEYLSDESGLQKYLSDGSGLQEYLSDESAHQEYLSDGSGLQEYLSDESGLQEYLYNGNGLEEYLSDGSGLQENISDGNDLQEYLYDGSGLQVEVTADGATQEYLYDGSGVYESNSSLPNYNYAAVEISPPEALIQYEGSGLSDQTGRGFSSIEEYSGEYPLYNDGSGDLSLEAYSANIGETEEKAFAVADEASGVTFDDNYLNDAEPAVFDEQSSLESSGEEQPTVYDVEELYLPEYAANDELVAEVELGSSEDILEGSGLPLAETETDTISSVEENGEEIKASSIESDPSEEQSDQQIESDGIVFRTLQHARRHQEEDIEPERERLLNSIYRIVKSQSSGERLSEPAWQRYRHHSSVMNSDHWTALLDPLGRFSSSESHRYRPRFTRHGPHGGLHAGSGHHPHANFNPNTRIHSHAGLNAPNSIRNIDEHFIRFVESQPADIISAMAHTDRYSSRMKRGVSDPVDCQWTIKTKPHLYLLVTIHNLSAPFTLDCSGAYIEVERENDGFEARWCGNRVRQVGSRPHMVFARGEIRIAVFNDGLQADLPTGFDAQVEVIDLLDARQYASFRRSGLNFRRLIQQPVLPAA